ncbi:hypothetical protein ILUMI_25357 [Ignelater luminosus]|uniref:Uncharacterized protein n=1 Tax=Ignelater luminosus TaxID=2038154 RepID=A0A8K0C5P1_IGNLU|nr:hypothetical protein ILUMI_25357 [Ignelater luminosus]
MSKRQGDLLTFSKGKNKKTDNTNETEANLEAIEQPTMIEKKAEEPLCSFRDEINNLAYPDCWNEKAVAFFTEQYKWLQLKAVQSAPEPVMLFVALKELMSTTAECIFNTLLSTLNDCGFHNEYLKAHLIAFCSDGASTILGRKSGVAAKMLESFPKIIVWHCLNHRLQLSLDDSISEIKHVNHFKIFLDKIYSFYHQSNKNQTELETIAKELEIEIIKIGRVLGPRWAACSLRATIAVWRAYPALYMHFCNSSHYGMAKRLATINFLQDLALMIDIFEELIKLTIRALENLKMGIGNHESQVEDLSEKFKDIPFNRSNTFIVLPRTMLLENIIQHMNLRLLSDRNNNEEIFHYFDLLEPATWPYGEVTSPWTAAERKLKSKNDPVPATIQKAKKIVSTIAISSAEAERGFSLMNAICTKVRNSLTVDHISDLMTINLLGKELMDWDATPFVKSWLNCNHRLATDTQVRQRSTKGIYCVIIGIRSTEQSNPNMYMVQSQDDKPVVAVHSEHNN